MEDFVVSFSDEDGQERTEKETKEMIESLRAVANVYGFDVCSYGTYSCFRQALGKGIIADLAEKSSQLLK